MSRYPEPRGPVEALFCACVGLLGAVIALSLALYLLAKIWLWLVIIGAIAGASWALTRWLRSRQQY